jgi:acyl carrier protein phosphodiesterase
MNYLAHIFLSGNDNQLMIGNFIADFVKGNKKNNYPDGIKAGIELHRSIDDFTDHHEITSISKSRLYSKQHKYAGPVVDVFYDHFLAKNFSKYSEIPLDEFTSNTYRILQSNLSILPMEVQQFLPYMIERNWLLNYATLDGIDRSLKGIGKRLSFQNNLNTAKEDLVENYSEFEKEFFLFFPQLINFAKSIITK